MWDISSNLHTYEFFKFSFKFFFFFSFDDIIQQKAKNNDVFNKCFSNILSRLCHFYLTETQTRIWITVHTTITYEIKFFNISKTNAALKFIFKVDLN